MTDASLVEAVERPRAELKKDKRRMSLMDRIDELLQRATPDLGRRDHLRNVFHEWERVETLAHSRAVQVPLIVREGPAINGAGIVISATDSEELEQIREELADAGVPVVRLVPDAGA